jgi:hypothetical protein
MPSTVIKGFNYSENKEVLTITLPLTELINIKTYRKKFTINFPKRHQKAGILILT